MVQFPNRVTLGDFRDGKFPVRLVLEYSFYIAVFFVFNYNEYKNTKYLVIRQL